MIGHLAFAALLILAPIAFAVQYAYWRGRLDTATKALRADIDAETGKRYSAEAAATVANRRADVAEVVVETLTNDLAQAHRANTLLRTGILDAEREANEMAQVLALPIELSERRAR
jgi:hypothetical protein